MMRIGRRCGGLTRLILRIRLDPTGAVLGSLKDRRTHQSIPHADGEEAGAAGGHHGRPPHHAGALGE